MSVMADQYPVIGSGFKFPIKVNSKGGLDWSRGPQRIQDAIWIIISTSLGERVMRPTFGAGAEDFVFQPNSAASQARLSAAISSALAKWEPRIEVSKVSVTTAPQVPSSVLVSVQYTIRSTNELYNMVYPLYVQEGLG
jgi:phage baseplate assembly protein W